MSFERINETDQHELDVIDAIVRGGGEARPEDAALTDFALLVRNARAVPDHGEAAALDARIQESQEPSKPRERMIFKPAFAGLCALVLLIGISGAAYLSSTGSNDSMGLSLSEGPSAGDMSQESGTASSAAPAIAPGPPSGVTPAKAPREVARDTQLTLAADGADIERISDRVNSIVDKYGGYVAVSQVRGGEGNRGEATFNLMIPADQYKPALAELSKLAHVRSRSQSSEDITTEVNSADRALKRLTARANRLEDQLAGATSAQQRIVLRRQLVSANAAKRQAAARVRTNRARVNYVPIALTIVADESAADKDKGAIAKAFDRAGTILTAVAAVLIVVLSVLIPLALIFAAGWFGYRRWNRGRSERAIDAAAVQPE